MCIRDRDLGALLVAIHAQLFLGFRMQEGGADVLAVHLHLLHAVTQQGAGSRGQAFHLHVHAAATGQILTADPLGREADTVYANVLVGD